MDPSAIWTARARAANAKVPTIHPAAVELEGSPPAPSDYRAARSEPTTLSRRGPRCMETGSPVALDDGTLAQPPLSWLAARPRAPQQRAQSSAVLPCDATQRNRTARGGRSWLRVGGGAGDGTLDRGGRERRGRRHPCAHGRGVHEPADPGRPQQVGHLCRPCRIEPSVPSTTTAPSGRAPGELEGLTFVRGKYLRNSYVTRTRVDASVMRFVRGFGPAGRPMGVSWRTSLSDPLRVEGRRSWRSASAALLVGPRRELVPFCPRLWR